MAPSGVIVIVIGQSTQARAGIATLTQVLVVSLIDWASLMGHLSADEIWWQYGRDWRDDMA